MGSLACRVTYYMYYGIRVAHVRVCKYAWSKRKAAIGWGLGYFYLAYIRRGMNSCV